MGGSPASWVCWRMNVGSRWSERHRMDQAGITLRVELRADTLLGPGKAALLEGIRDTGSIAAAGRRMGMSYKGSVHRTDPDIR